MKTRQFDTYYENYSKSMQQITVMKQAPYAYAETMTVYEEQIKLYEKFQKEAQPHEIRMYNFFFHISRKIFNNKTYCSLQEKI